jgi:hypothetical protein
MWYRDGNGKLVFRDGTAAKKNNFERLAGAGLSRLLHHMVSGPFAVMSAHRGTGDTPESRAENNRRQKELKRHLRDKGYGFIETHGAWKEDADLPFVREHSVFIPNIGEADAHELGAIFDQQAVLVGDDGRARVNFLDGETPPMDLGHIRDSLHIVQPGDSPDVYTEIGGKQFMFDPSKPSSENPRLNQASNGHYYVFEGRPPTGLAKFGRLESPEAVPVGSLSVLIPLSTTHG